MENHPTALYLQAFEADLAKSGYSDCDINSRDVTQRDVALTLCRRSFIKKLSTASTSAAADSAAIDLFRHMNTKAQTVGGKLPYARHMLFRRWKPVDSVEQLLSCSKLIGPGSSVGSRSYGSLFHKIVEFDWSCTNDVLVDAFVRALSSNPLWYAMFYHRACAGRGHKRVEGSKLFCVPKTHLISRTAATEPTINMAFQLGLGKVLDDHLYEVYGYDASVQQTRNRALAQRGSIDGSVATIDLTSASDLIGREFCRYLLPENLFALLEDVRSPYVTIGADHVELNMISTMGNGFTFPLQTLIFCLICEQVAFEQGVELDRMDKVSNFGIFGDDIIVPSVMFEPLLSRLQELRMQPNTAKSFSGTSPFRESCGGDFWCGHNVRGVYFRDDTLAGRFSIINRLIRHATHWSYVPYETVMQLKPANWERYCIPKHSSDAEGIHVPHYRGRSYYLKERKKFCELIRAGISRHGNEAGVLLSALHGELRDGSLTLRQEKGTVEYYDEPVRPYEWDRRINYSYGLNRSYGRSFWTTVGTPSTWYSHNLSDLDWIATLQNIL